LWSRRVETEGIAAILDRVGVGWEDGDGLEVLERCFCNVVDVYEACVFGDAVEESAVR